MKKPALFLITIFFCAVAAYFKFSGKPEINTSEAVPSADPSPRALTAPPLKIEAPKPGPSRVAEKDPSVPVEVNKTQLALQTAQTYLAGSETELAATTLRKALQEDPENLELLIQLGNIYAAEFKDLSTARGFFERALAKSPGDGELLGDLVNIYQQTGNTEGGVNFLKTVIKAHPDNPQAYNAAADLLISSRRYPEAAAVLERAANLPQATDTTQYLYAQTLTQVGTPEALQRAEQAYGNILSGREKVLQERAAKGLPTEVAQANRDTTMMDIIRFKIRTGDFSEANRELLDVKARRPNDERLAQISHELEMRQRSGSGHQGE